MEQKRLFKAGLSSSIIPEEVMNSVWEENRTFLTDKYAHDEDFFKVKLQFLYHTATNLTKHTAPSSCGTSLTCTTTNRHREARNVF